MTEVVSEEGTHVTKEELISTFEEVLNDYGVISKSAAQSMIEKRLEELQKDDEAHVAESPEEFEDDGGYTPQDLQEVLPDDVWRVVRRYVAQDGAPLPEADEVDGDVEKAVTDAITTSGETLTKVRGELAAQQEPSTSYEGTGKSVSTSDMLLTNFYDSVGTPKPIRKRKAKETFNPALRQIEEDL